MGNLLLLVRCSDSTFVFLSQHNQWICLTTKRRAQDFPVEGFIASAQSKITQCLPSTGEFVEHNVIYEKRGSAHKLFTGHIFLEVYLNILVQTCFEYADLFMRAARHCASCSKKTDVHPRLSLGHLRVRHTFTLLAHREAKSLPFRGSSMGPYFGKVMHWSQWREKDYLSIPFELCHELHIWCLSIHVKSRK